MKINNIVKVIKADCLIDNIGSIKTLEKCGMCEVKRDNKLIYWEKKSDILSSFIKNESVSSIHVENLYFQNYT